MVGIKTCAAGCRNASAKEMSFSTDMQLTLTGAAQVSPDGIVFGNKKVKIGTTLELEGKTYNFNSTVIALRQKS